MDSFHIKGVPDFQNYYYPPTEFLNHVHFQVILLQVAVPSRTNVQEYQDLKDELDREIGRINGKISLIIQG